MVEFCDEKSRVSTSVDPEWTTITEVFRSDVDETITKAWLTFIGMSTVQARLHTFKKWPYHRGKLIAEKMAEAGFYRPTGKHVSQDAVRCFVCLKELENWDPDDDPMGEHLRHQPSCAFAKLRKCQARMTRSEFLAIMCEYLKLEMRTIYAKKLSDLKAEIATGRGQFFGHLDDP